MSDHINDRCSCPRCTIRGLMSPAIIITVGVIFLLDQMRGGFFSFGNTWPVILIVMGIVSLASALAPVNGHVSQAAPPPMPPSPPASNSSSLPSQGQ